LHRYSWVRAGLPGGYAGHTAVSVGAVDVTADVVAGVLLNANGVGFSDNERLTVFVCATDAAGNAQQLTTSIAVITVGLYMLNVQAEFSLLIATRKKGKARRKELASLGQKPRGFNP
jgi:hypothetical protein